MGRKGIITSYKQLSRTNFSENCIIPTQLLTLATQLPTLPLGSGHKTVPHIFLLHATKLPSSKFIISICGQRSCRFSRNMHIPMTNTPRKRRDVLSTKCKKTLFQRLRQIKQIAYFVRSKYIYFLNFAVLQFVILKLFYY